MQNVMKAKGGERFKSDKDTTNNKCQHLLNPNYGQALAKGFECMITFNLHNNLFRRELFPLLEMRKLAEKH